LCRGWVIGSKVGILSRTFKPAKTFEELHIIQKARCMTIEIWRITRARPFSTDRVLVNQIRRAGLSIVSNIAEGLERGSRAEFGRFLKIAKGSCGEVRAQMQIASDQNYISKQDCADFCLMAKRVSAGLSNLAQYLKETPERTGQSSPGSA
jgi:four helix bundle protein